MVQNIKTIRRFSLCVRLLLASKELILLLHLLHAEAGLSVLLRLALCLCGPILHPGSLTENILVPAEAKDESVVRHGSDLKQIQFMFVATAAARILLKLTFVLGRLCECLWMYPWVGRFFLFPNSKIPCSVDNWGIGGPFPEEPRRCYLKRKASRCIHTGITRQFPNFSLVYVTLTDIMTNVTVVEAATLAASADGGTTTAAAPASTIGGCIIHTFLGDVQDPHCIHVSRQVSYKLFHSDFIHWGQTTHSGSLSLPFASPLFNKRL